MIRKTSALALAALLLISMAMALPPQGAGGGYDALKAAAEREFAEKSFSRAHELYEQAAALKLSDDERRWVEFRLADTAWRTGGDGRDEAIRKLGEIVAKEPHDRVWAEANESLGDHSSRTYQGAQTYYLAALDYWAGSDEIDYARGRYLDIVWRLTGEGDRYGYAVPREVLVNALTIANTEGDRARVRYLLAKQLMNERTAASRERALEHVEWILSAGRKTEWYDDALFLAGQLWDEGAMIVRGDSEDEGQSYVKALAYYRRILSELKPGETRWYNDAKNAVENITAPSLTVNASATFLPSSEQEVLVTWRNVKEVQLALTPVDLTRDVEYRTNRNWIDAIRTEGRAAIRNWTLATNDSGEHHYGSEAMRLSPRLAPGAYVLTAQAGGRTARTLVLVTDAHVLLHATRDRLQVFVSDVLTGEPIANARVVAWQQLGNEPVSKSALTNASGIADITASPDARGTLLITAGSGARQAYHSTYHYAPRASDQSGQWRVYAFTDRPAYRPEETVQWKIVARVRQNDRWITPAGAALEYEITSPRGEKVASGKATLTEFGTFWAELPLTTAMPLGAYSIRFKSENGQAAYAALFRLEEYKLPEFRVSVKTDKQYRLGDTIEAQIEAEYYFGGPVANAEVEAVVYQQPFVRYWYPWRREYPWYFPDTIHRGGDAVMKRETLRTDADGRATLRIETPADGNETSYRIEARVVDASRREVRGEGTVRVTRQRYAVFATPEHYLHAPGASVSIDFKAMDANDQPVQTTGTVTVLRRNWRQERNRYGDEEVTKARMTTDEKGETTFTFTPKREGYYVVTWQSEDGTRARDLITAETTIWVADRRTTDVGYRAGALDVIVDKETFRSGQTATALVVTPASGRWVVLTTSADDILDTQVLHLDGMVKVVQIPLDERHVPNFFIAASSVFDRQIATDIERVVVPPVEHFIDVEVKSDREEYAPRQEGTITVTTRGADGKPVAAEVALAVSDESVTAIQQDLAGDPRPFFFGEVRSQTLQVTGSAQSQRYRKLVVGERGEVLDEEEEKERRESGYYEIDALQEGVEGGVEGSVYGGIAGGVVGGVMSDATGARAASPAPVPPAEALTEAITVTAQAPLLAKEENRSDDAGMEVEVRTDFRSTALWKPDLVTDKSGTATVKVKFPESLTTWRATARAASAGAEFGMGTSTSRTNLPLLVRLQAPRFFVAGDRVVVSAVINNNTSVAMLVTPSLDVEGLALERGGQAIPPVRVEPRSEARADWTVVAEKAGPAKLRVTARGTAHADAMERTFTVYEHGIDKLIARSGKLRADEAVVRLDLPRERRGTDLVVQVAPSLAVAMLDALPYLIEYPYGCTEQTMSRFLPAAIVARTLAQLGLDPKRVDDKKLKDVTAKGMARLYDFQHGDSGWGWWKEGSSDDFMTAYVVWGFAVARDGGLAVRSDAVDRAAVFLERRLVENEDRPNDQAWMLHALSAWRRGKASDAERRAFENAWKNRENLTSYSRALLALTAHRYGDTERTAVLVRNLENGAKIDRTPDQSVLIRGAAGSPSETMSTARWGEDRFWWRWHDGPVESTAFVLQALVTIDPKHRLVEPAMNWLVKNRRGAQWNNTRDTAIALLALNDYLKASGELAGDVAYEVSVNGRSIASKTVTAKDVLGAPSRFAVDPALLAEGMQEIRIRRTAGTSPLYFAAEARFVSLEEPVKPAGNELFVKREYFRLAARPTLLKGVQYDRVPLKDRDSIVSGERIEVLVTIESKNDYAYLMFEDLKPAGFEAVALQSGQPLWATGVKSGKSAWVYQELRDRKVAMFIDHLQQGVWEIRYTLRAEVPGSFHALPLLGQAMYVPDIRANGEEVRVEVLDRPSTTAR